MERAARASVALLTRVDNPTPKGNLLASNEDRGEPSLVRRLAKELFEGGAAVRARAASRLLVLLGQEASSLLVSALETEEEPSIVVRLLDLLGQAGDSEVLERIRAWGGDPRAEVRAAAVEASLLLAAPGEREALVSRGLSDPSPWVRRRTLLASAAAVGLDVGPLAAERLDDPDRHVRRMACLALSGTSDAAAAAQVAAALLDEDEGVRRAAESASVRLFGERAEGLADLPAHGRRIAVSRLQAWIAARLPSWQEEGRLLPLERREVAERRTEEPVVRAKALPPATEEEVEAIAELGMEAPIPFDAVEEVLLAAIRGAHPEELARELRRDPGEVERALDGWLAEGRIVRRGKKIYLP